MLEDTSAGHPTALIVVRHLHNIQQLLDNGDHPGFFHPHGKSNLACCPGTDSQWDACLLLWEPVRNRPLFCFDISATKSLATFARNKSPHFFFSQCLQNSLLALLFFRETSGCRLSAQSSPLPSPSLCIIQYESVHGAVFLFIYLFLKMRYKSSWRGLPPSCLVAQ